jgi:low affinity Fe/Cu permease
MFDDLARRVERAVGSQWAFFVALAIVLIWATTGPLFEFSDTWQLVINTGTTIVTFLMVFLIQATQSRDTMAIHVKLDELLRAIEGARNSLIDAEDMEKSQLNKVRQEMHRTATQSPEALS